MSKESLSRGAGICCAADSLRKQLTSGLIEIELQDSLFVGQSQNRSGVPAVLGHCSLWFANAYDLLSRHGGTQQELRAAIQVDVLRCGNDDGFLHRARRRGIDRKSLQAEYPAAIGRQPARRGQPAHGA